MRRSPLRSGGAPLRGPWRAACAGLVLAAAALGCAERSPAHGVVLLTVDSLRADHVSTLGRANPRDPAYTTTPAFDAFAARGVVFEQAISSTSWTLPAHAALMTGLPDDLHGVLDNFKELSSQHVTLAELFRAAGCRTAGFYSGPNVHPAYGFGQGFEQYVDKSFVDVEPERLADHQVGDLRDVHLASHRAVTSPALLDASGAFLDEVAASGERFFLFVHWWDPHYDYLAPQEVAARFVDPDYAGRLVGHHAGERRLTVGPDDVAHLRALYDAEIRFTDDHVGELLRHLDALGLAESTAVAWTADHGEEFYEHGRWGHQRTLFDEVVRVPLAFAGAGVPSGVRIGAQVRLYDVFATLCDLGDVAPPAYVVGKSLVPWFDAPPSEGHPALLRVRVPRMGSPVDLTAVRFEHAKVQRDHETGATVVFDLAADPREQRPIAAARAAGPLALAVARFEREIAALDDVRPRVPGASAAGELPAHLRQQLDAAGYLGEAADDPDERDAD